MEIYTRTINLDFAQKGNPKKIFAKQGDRLSRQLLILPTINGVYFKIAETAKVRFACQKADKTQVLTDKGIDTASTGGEGILVLIPESVMTAAGFALCEIIIEFDNGAVISSENFIIDVVENPLDGSIESHDDYQAFKKELAKLRGGVTWAIHDNFGEDTVMAIEIDEANSLGDYTMQVGDLVIDNEGKIGQIELLDKERYNAIVRYITTIEAGLPNYSEEEDAFKVLTVSPNGNLFWGSTRVDDLTEKIDEEIIPTIEKNTADIESQKVSIVNHDKRITNLEKGLPSDHFVTDDTTAYIKDVPADALPFAAVTKIGGMTIKDGDTLKSAKVTAVESVGANASDISTPESGYFYDSSGDATSANSRFIRFWVRDVKPNTTYTLSCNLSIYTIWEDDGANPTKIKQVGSSDKVTFTTSDNTRRLRVTVNNTSGVADTTAFSWFMINHGNEAKPYVPYSGKHTLELPEAAQVENGINADCHDYIEWADNARVKHIKVGVIDMGALEWNYSLGGKTRFDSNSLANVIKKVSQNNVANIICGKYENVGSASQVYDGNAQIAVNGTYIWILDTDYADAASFKAAMQGVMLYYELANPVVTDISDLLTEDNLIEVEGGGTITFVNENGLAVPSTIKYQVKGV